MVEDFTAICAVLQFLVLVYLVSVHYLAYRYDYWDSNQRSSLLLFITSISLNYKPKESNCHPFYIGLQIAGHIMMIIGLSSIQRYQR